MTNMTAVLDTQFNDSGTTKASAAFRGMQKDMTNTAQGAATLTDNLDRAGKRMERPLGRTFFAMASEEMLGVNKASDAASGQVMALERGFHALSMASMVLTGPMGTVALVAAGLIALFLKLRGSTDDARVSIEKKQKALREDAEAMTHSADVLYQQGKITKDEAIHIRELANEKVKDIEKTNQQITGSINYTSVHKHEMDQIIAHMIATGQDTSAIEQSLKVKKEITNTEAEALGMSADIEAGIKKRTEAMKMYIESLQKAYDAQLKVNEVEGKAIGEAAKLRSEADKKKLTELQKFSEEFMKNSITLGKDILSGNKDMLNKDIAQLADAEAMKLFIQAAADIWNNPVKGALEAAAGVALEVVAGQFGGGGSSSPVSATPTTSTGGGASQSNSGTSQQMQQMSLQVIIQGGVLDDNAAINVAKRIFEVGSTYGVQIVNQQR